MNSKWRYIEEDGSTASYGLAADEYLTRLLSTSPYSHILRLYTYRDYCALIGRHQDVGAELHLAYCKRMGIEINRRPTGGGAIIMGQGQLGIALATSIVEGYALRDSVAVFEYLSRGIIAALRHIGIVAEFWPKNDLLVRGSKIAGLASSAQEDAGLFHASLLVDMNQEVMLKVLKKPARGPRPITTVSEELGRRPGTHEIREVMMTGFKEAFNIELVTEPFSPEEFRKIKTLEEEKYRSWNWVYEEGYAYAGPPESRVP